MLVVLQYRCMGTYFATSKSVRAALEEAGVSTEVALVDGAHLPSVPLETTES